MGNLGEHEHRRYFMNEIFIIAIVLPLLPKKLGPVGWGFSEY